MAYNFTNFLKSDNNHIYEISSIESLYRSDPYITSPVIITGYPIDKENLDHIPIMCVYNNVDICRLKLKTLQGIGKSCFTLIEGSLTIRDSIKQNILGLLTIDLLEDVQVQITGLNEHNSSELLLACNIINGHIFNDKDILDCQEELIQEELKYFARL